MKNRLVIVGAGGHGKVVADNAIRNGYTEIYFADDHRTEDCMGFPVIGGTSDLAAFDDGRTDFIIGIGSNAVREIIAQQHRVNWVSLIHPSAQIASHVSIGAGTVVMAGAVINACANVGKHCIINSGAIVEHDNHIADYVHISPRAALGGTVSIGPRTHVGIGAVVKNNIAICEDCIIGAGAVVVKNTTSAGTYVGVPVKKIR